MRATAEVMTGRPRGPGRERAGHRAYQRAERRPLLERSVREQIEDRRRGGDQSDHGADQRREVGRAEYRERDTEHHAFCQSVTNAAISSRRASTSDSPIRINGWRYSGRNIRRLSKAGLDVSWGPRPRVRNRSPRGRRDSQSAATLAKSFDGPSTSG